MHQRWKLASKRDLKKPTPASCISKKCRNSVGSVCFCTVCLLEVWRPAERLRLALGLKTSWYDLWKVMVSAWTFSENIASIRKHSCKTSKFVKFFQPPCVALGKITAPSNLKRQLQGGISGSARRTWGFDLPFQSSDWCEGARLIKAGWPKSAQAARTWGMSASMTSTCNTTRAKRCFMLHIEATESEMWELRKKTNWYKPCQQIHRQRVNARVIYFHGALRAFHKYHHYHRAIGSWQMVQIKRKHKSGIDFEAGFF